MDLALHQSVAKRKKRRGKLDSLKYLKAAVINSYVKRRREELRQERVEQRLREICKVPMKRHQVGYELRIQNAQGMSKFTEAACQQMRHPKPFRRELFGVNNNCALVPSQYKNQKMPVKRQLFSVVGVTDASTEQQDHVKNPARRRLFTTLESNPDTAATVYKQMIHEIQTNNNNLISQTANKSQIKLALNSTGDEFQPKQHKMPNKCTFTTADIKMVQVNVDSGAQPIRCSTIGAKHFTSDLHNQSFANENEFIIGMEIEEGRI